MVGVDAVMLSEEDRRILGEVEENEISSEVRRHAASPVGYGFMERPDGQAQLTGMCEDTVLFHVRVKGKTVTDVCFQTNGCGFTKACGSAAAELVQGKNIGFALGLTGEQIIASLNGLPRGHVHCAHLAANTLKKAAQDALQNQREPWRLLFRR